MADDTTSTALEGQTLGALIDMLKSAATPDALQAQSILLRRLALQGDITGSRVPAPVNITEIGGYINLLEKMQQPEILSQTLTAILGVAGPNPPLGWLSARPALSMVVLTNDRPAVPAQPSIPLTFAVRVDFAAAVQEAIKALHDRGCTLPLLSPATVLPEASPGIPVPSDVLPFLGRVLDMVPAAALRDPATDPIVLARASGSADRFQIAARVFEAGAVAVTPANWDVLICDGASCTPTALSDARYVPLGPALAEAGFYPESPLPQPSSLSSVGWARFTNVTGLVAGVTRLADELTLLHSTADINNSVFASRLRWVWNGTAFAAAV